MDGNLNLEELTKDLASIREVGISNLIFPEVCTGASPWFGLFDDIYIGFKNPLIDSHLFMCWWWNVYRLSKKEIFSKPDVM